MEEPNRIIEVEHPLHIPAIVYELKLKSLKANNSFYTILEHKEEPCIVRGVGQVMLGDFDFEKGYHLLNDIPEIKRQDGGNSWYHGPTTCLIKTMPHQKDLVKQQLEYQIWHNELSTMYWFHSKNRVVRRLPNSADLYEKNNLSSQIFGTSGYNNLFRACWYEDISKEKDLLDFVSRDPQVESISDFKESLGFAKQGFGDHLHDWFAFEEKVSSSNFISSPSLEQALDLQYKPGFLVGPCISGEYPKRVSPQELDEMRLRGKYV